MRSRLGRLNEIGSRFRPYERYRVGPLREGAFPSPLHSERTAAWLGLALGISFTVCFATGLISHVIQHPPSWFTWPARPAGLYRITQGVHVATGIASIPLLLAKLWTVYPRFWTWPLVESIAHALERLSLVPLVGGSLFLLFSGVASIIRWYPWAFSFPSAHYSAAWITIGALVVHIGAKLASIRRGLARPRGAALELTGTTGMSRKAFLTTVAAATGGLTLVTVGQTVRQLEFLGLLSPRKPTYGPQNLPVNKTAMEARISDLALDPGFRLSVTGNIRTPLSLSPDELRSMPQHEATLPITCVDGWSANASWRGVRVADLLRLAGAPSEATAQVVSLQPGGAYTSSLLEVPQAHDPDTLFALEVNGEPLHLDHGFPVRLIGPNRPGVLQTKWVSKLVIA